MTHENRAVRPARAHLVIAALVAALLLLAAVPAFASAAGIEVNSLNDSPQLTPGPNCDTGAPAGEQCTLRAAIEAADYEPDPSLIEFLKPPFEGGQQIALGSTLPPITEPVTITAQSHVYSGYNGPSVGVTIPAGAVGLRVQSDGVAVENVAFGGGKVGIEVQAGAKDFTATGDWFGLAVTGAAAPIQTEALVLRSGADGAIIGAGEHEAETRNVFTHSSVGIEIYGASKTKVLGNYIGVEPDGSEPATVGLGVYVHNGPTLNAEETEIGGVLSTTEAETPVCDGACNVITTDGATAISIYGEAASPGHRSIVRGNFIGLEADGVTPVGETTLDVTVSSGAVCGDGPEVTVGGTFPTETNYIVGGTRGIVAEGVENFTAAGNAIGIGADGEPSVSPEEVGIELCAEDVTGTAHITGNRIALEAGENIGILSSWGHAEITGNSIEGGSAGIVTNEESEGAGDLIQGNSIIGVERQGIEIGEESDSNVVIGNTITKAGWVGISLEKYADGNRIGGDGPGEANTFIESGVRGNPEDGAISMSSRAGVRNEFAANTGFGNNLAFIKLGPNPIEGEIPNGILPPALTTAQQSSASGTTAPEAIVRVYAKASAEPGELGAQLAKVQADAAGNWKATFAKQPVGTLVAATATKEGGTSELSATVTTAADPEEEKGSGGNGGGGGGSSTGPGPGTGTTTGPPPPAAIAKVAPKVKITSGPKKSSTATTAKLKFKVTNVDRAKFECKLDGAKWAGCKSPKTYRKLKAGKHTFQVRAKANGLTGGVVKYQFTIKV